MGNSEVGRIQVATAKNLWQVEPVFQGSRSLMRSSEVEELSSGTHSRKLNTRLAIFALERVNAGKCHSSGSVSVILRLSDLILPLHTKDLKKIPFATRRWNSEIRFFFLKVSIIMP